MATSTLDISESPVKTYTRMLHQLHELFGVGRGDSEEADAIRDEMDAPWYAMSKQERERMGGLSEDLYALSEHNSRGVPMGPAERTAWSREGTEAIANGSFDRALELLRKPPENMPLPNIWFLQARCWERLGDYETALLFMRAAAKLDRKFTFCLLSLLAELGQKQQLIEVANSLLNDPKSDPADVYFASGPLLEQASEMGDEAAKQQLERLASALNEALAKVQKIPKINREVPNLDSHITCMLAHCYRRLNESDRAFEIYERALSRNPADAEIRTCRGIELLDQEPDLALKDFEIAVENNTDSVWPYVVLAKNALRQRKYDRCLSFAERGVGKTTDPELLAELHEAIAISRAELDWPPSRVMESFENALRYAPDNDRIRQNCETAKLHTSSRELRVRFVLPIAPDHKPNPADAISSRSALKDLKEKREMRFA